MLRAYGFLCVENETDWNKNYDVRWGRIADNAISEKPTTFPAFFKLQESWDSHFCGKWIPCKKELMVNACLAEIAEHQKKLEAIKNI